MSFIPTTTFSSLRAEFPGASPEALFNTACLRLGEAGTWDTASVTIKSLWLDAFSTVDPYSPTSATVH